MSAALAVPVVVALLLVLLLLRLPVWLSLAVSGAAGLFLLRGESFVTNTLAAVAYEQTSSFTLTIIPMFILLGVFAVKAKIAEQVFAIARRIFRETPGGIGIATVAACAGFAAVSGSTIGTTATMAKLSVEEMRRSGYSQSLAGALVAVAGTIGAMIPPSLFLVLYAILTMEPIGEMLVAGIIPGVLSAVAFAVYVLIRTRKMPALAETPARPGALVGASAGSGASGAGLDDALGTAIADAREAGERTRLPWRGLVRLVIIFAIIMGGIYLGFFTPTESAAIGALAALIMLVLEFRRQGIRTIVAQFVDALKETAKTTSMVFAIVFSSALLSLFFVVARVPQSIGDFVGGLDVPPWLVIAILLAFLLPLGMALESISILVITVPLIYPVATELGFDGIWLGVMIVKLIEIGMVTPPVGINCFVVAGTARIPTAEVFKGVWPFVVVELVLLAILFVFPQLATWLPSFVQ